MQTSTTHDSIRQALRKVETSVAHLAETGLEQEVLDLAQAELAELKASAHRLLDQDEFVLIGLISDRSPAWRDYRTKLDQVRQFLQSLN